MRDIEYFISQAFKNVIRNGLMSIASIFTVLCCLVIVGIFTFMVFNVNYISKQIQNQCEVQAFIEKGTTEQQVKAIGDEIRKIPKIKEAVIFTKEDTLTYVKSDMFKGKEAVLEGFDKDNPFRDSYKITLNDIVYSRDVVNAIKEIPKVADVENKQDIVDKVLSISKMASNVSLWIMILLIIVSIALISNTIKITVFSRRKEINIMKYIGATNKFIRMPFLFEGMIIGFFGAIFAFAVTSWGYLLVLDMIKANNLDIFMLLPFENMAANILGIFILIGVGIGSIGSILSIGRHLKV